MHTCPECGKTMATGGGLEIHAQLAHAPQEPEPAVRELVPETAAVVSLPLPEPAPVPAPLAPNRPSPLRGYDPTIPLTALLVIVMFLASIGAALHRV